MPAQTIWLIPDETFQFGHVFSLDDSPTVELSEGGSDRLTVTDSVNQTARTRTYFIDPTSTGEVTISISTATHKYVQVFTIEAYNYERTFNVKRFSGLGTNRFLVPAVEITINSGTTPQPNYFANPIVFSFVPRVNFGTGLIDMSFQTNAPGTIIAVVDDYNANAPFQFLRRRYFRIIVAKADNE